MSQATITLNCAVSGTTYTTNANAALAAIDSMHSGDDEPTTNLTDGKMWLDTDPDDDTLNMVKIRIGNNWHNLWDFDGTEFYAEQAKLATTVPDAAITEPKLAIDNTAVVDYALYVKTAAVAADDTVTPEIAAADAVMEWRQVPTSAGTSVQANPPAAPNDDDVWIDSGTGVVYVYQANKTIQEGGVDVIVGSNWIQTTQTAQIPENSVTSGKLADNLVLQDVKETVGSNTTGNVTIGNNDVFTIYRLTGTAAQTVTFPTPAAANMGKSLTIVATNNLVTFAGSLIWSEGSLPDRGGSGTDLYVFFSDGVNWFGSQAGIEFAGV